MAYTVTKPVKVKGVVYQPGDIIADDVTERDIRRHTYSRRFVQVEDIAVAGAEESAPVTESPKTLAKPAAPVKPAASTTNGTTKSVTK